jgi:putative aldouronate transport system permease protein
MPILSSRHYSPNSISIPANIILNVFVGLFALACVIPLILVISISLTDNQTVIAEGFKLIPPKFSTEAYTFLFSSDNELIRSYIVTIFVTATGTVASIVMMSLCAYPLSRKYFRYRSQFSLIIYFTMLFNGGMIPFYIVVSQLLHMKNTVWALIVPSLVSPMYVLILRTFMSVSVPDEIIESAKIDGASEFTIFARIVVTLSMPGMATIALFMTLAYWNSWFNALLFMDTRKYMPLQYLLMKIERGARFMYEHPELVFTAGANPPTETLTMATAVATIGPIILAYPFFQKYYVRGLTLGAVKG